MLERCLISFFSGRQIILVVILFLGMTSCTTLQPAEKKAAFFSPPDINRIAPVSEGTAPPLVVSDGLPLEKTGHSKPYMPGSLVPFPRQGIEGLCNRLEYHVGSLKVLGVSKG